MIFYKQAIELIKKRKNSIIIVDQDKQYTTSEFLNDIFLILCFFENENIVDKNIMIDIPKSYYYLITFFALLISKNTPIPIDSKKTPLKRKEYIAKDSNAFLILDNNKITEILSSNYKNIDISYSNNKDEKAYMIYTSGSTGKPKGVNIAYRGIMNVILEQIKILNLQNENIYWFNSTAFDASISDILCSFFSDSTLFIKDSIISNKREFIKYIELNNITFIDIPPSYLSILDVKKINSIKKFLIGGEVANKSKINLLIKNSIEIYNVYGPTEATICTSIKKMELNSEINNIGKPINGIQYKIINNELVMSGENLFLSYQNITNNNLKNNVYYTGDLACINEYGDYLFLGRKDRQVKINGQMVCPEEIENQIMSLKFNKSGFAKIENKKITAFIDGNIEKTKLHIEKHLPIYMQPKEYIKVVTKRKTNHKIEKNE